MVSDYQLNCKGKSDIQPEGGEQTQWGQIINLDGKGRTTYSLKVEHKCDEVR
jgi:hypothetical protein